MSLILILLTRVFRGQAAEKTIKSRLLEMKADIEKEYSETNRTYVFKRKE